MLGAGGFALEVADLAEDAGFVVAGLVEGLDTSGRGEARDGRPVHRLDELSRLARDHAAIAGVGDPHARRRLVTAAETAGVSFATLVHPAAHVSKRARLGDGTVVSPGVVVGADATVGRHVILNRGVMIGHHTRIGEFASVMTGANVAGLATVGNDVYVGMCAAVLNGLCVGDGATIAAGAVVTRDVTSGAHVRGLPARPHDPASPA